MHHRCILPMQKSIKINTFLLKYLENGIIFITFATSNES
jgi:hypothetical protein